MSRNVVIVNHKFLTPPDEDLVIYLNGKKYDNVLHVMHSFSDAPDRCSFFQWYQKGKLIREDRSYDYRSLPTLLIYAKETFFTLYWIGRSGVVWDKFIGLDGLCSLWGIFLRLIGKVRKVTLWVIDFVPNNRFESRLKNLIYFQVNKYSFRNCDEIWDLGSRMIDARNQFMGIDPLEYKEHKLIPYGMWLNRIKHYDYKACEQKTLVYMGHMLEKQGIQHVIQAVPKIIQKVPEFQFKIIGTGIYKQSLLELAKNLNVMEYCNFLGYIEDICRLEDLVAQSALSVAPYLENEDNYTYYTDPGKVKTYLACGVPVLLTDVPWNAREIEDHQCGKIITTDPDRIAEEVISYLLAPDLLRNQRQNAIEYSKQFDYNQIFSDKAGL